MKSLATITNLYTALSTNTSALNQALGIQLASDHHRYLMEKYFDNERTYQTTTVGAQSLTTTAVMATNDVSATLTAVWAYPTVTQLVNFSNSNQRSVLFTYNSTAITWTGGLSASATTAITTVGVQAYKIPANISKIIDSTISIGQLRYTASTVFTRVEWDLLNTLPYTSDIVNQYFIYNGNVEFFPIPSTTGSIITFNYKCRVPDFSTAFLFSDAAGTAYVAGSTVFDYQKGTASGTVGSTTITGASTPAWSTAFPTGDVTKYNLYFMASPIKGDGIWYPISTIDSATQLTLASPLINAVTAGATYSIGQLPVLQEDFHDMLVDGPLMTYFGTVNKNEIGYDKAKERYDVRGNLLDAYAGTKQVNIDLGGPITPQNGNLYLYANSSS